MRACLCVCVFVWSHVCVCVEPGVSGRKFGDN